MPPPRANSRNVNARNQNRDPPVPYQDVSNAKFRNAMHKGTQSMTNHHSRVHAPVNKNGLLGVERLCDFVRMNPPEFLGSQINKDPQNFIDEIRKIFEVMHVTRNDQIELASCKLKDVA